MEKGLIFTYLLTYGGAALALVNPYCGLMAYICVSLIKPESLWSGETPMPSLVALKLRTPKSVTSESSAIAFIVLWTEFARCFSAEVRMQL